jgi:hypothetical protein
MGHRITSAADCFRTPCRPGWCLILLGCLAWLSLGCSPQTISMVLMPFVDNNIEPEYKLCTPKKEVKLVILASFAQAEFRDDMLPAETELPEHVKNAFRIRCNNTKYKVKVISSAEVRNFQQKEDLGTGETAALAIGKHFKADYVLDLSIRSFELYEPKSTPKLFRARTEIGVCLYKMNVKDEDPKVFTKSFSAVFPGEGRGPSDAGNTPAAALRQVFLEKVARNLTRLFISYDPEEKKMLE